MKTSTAPAIAAFLLAYPVAASALWVPDGVPLCTAPGTQENVWIAPDGGNGAFVVWEDYRNGERDVYAQRVTGSGAIVTGWPQNGVPVCTVAGDQVLPKVVSDGSGGALVSWLDSRNGASAIYALRLDGQGAVMPGWLPNGTLVEAGHLSTSCRVGSFNLNMVPGGDGGAILSYHLARTRLGKGCIPSQSAISTRIDGSGGIVWRTGFGYALSVLWGPHVSGDEAGGAILSANLRGGPIEALRIAADGTTAPGWPVQVTTQGGFPYLLSSVSDGSAGVILAWSDWGNDYDVLALRMESSGTVAPGWPAAGLVACDAPGSQALEAVARDDSGGAILLWRDNRDDEFDVYAQRVTASGSIAPGWTTNGVPVSTAPGGQGSARLASDGSGGAWIVWEDSRQPPAKIYALRMSGDGVPVPGWQQDGTPLSAGPGAQRRPNVASVGSDAAIAVWSDDRDGESDIYAQSLGVDGPVPVRVSLVSADASSDRVLLTWQGAGAANLDAHVYRRTVTGDWRWLGSPSVEGSDRLWFEDFSVTPGERHVYRLGFFEGGVEHFTAETWVDVPEALLLALEGLRPNPAVGELVVSFTLPDASPAVLDLLEVTGRRMLRREVGRLGAGRHLLRLGDGRYYEPGVYLVRLSQRGRMLQARCVLLR